MGGSCNFNDNFLSVLVLWHSYLFLYFFFYKTMCSFHIVKHESYMHTGWLSNCHHLFFRPPCILPLPLQALHLLARSIFILLCRNIMRTVVTRIVEWTTVPHDPMTMEIQIFTTGFFFMSILTMHCTDDVYPLYTHIDVLLEHWCYSWSSWFMIQIYHYVFVVMRAYVPCTQLEPDPQYPLNTNIHMFLQEKWIGPLDLWRWASRS